MYTCELCGGQVKKGYLVVDKKLDKPYIICQNCGRQTSTIDRQK